jgi:acyl-coenzyme A thioesterase PaaI-like protein
MVRQKIKHEEHKGNPKDTNKKNRNLHFNNLVSLVQSFVPFVLEGTKQGVLILIEKAFQDYYPEEVAWCYGCGRLNEHGLQVKSYWQGEETVCVFEPRPYHIAIPGYVYGGLIAALIDCHSTGSAAAAMYRAQERDMDTQPPFRFVTASLHIDYVRPTPLGVPLEVRAKVKEIKGRKVVVESTLSAQGEVCARGEVVAVQAPEHFFKKGRLADAI